MTATAAFGTPIFALDTSVVPDNAIVSLFNDGTTTTFDIRGEAQFDVYNPGFVGATFLEDSGGGTNNYTTPPFGNNFLIATNFASQVAAVVFDFTTPVFSNGGTTLLLIGTGSPFSPNPTTDPALSQLIGPLVYSFTFLSSSTSNTGTLSVFGLSGATSEAVPEPSTIVELSAGLGILLLSRRFGRRLLNLG